MMVICRPFGVFDGCGIRSCVRILIAQVFDD
jgi:hypothetical protein